MRILDCNAPGSFEYIEADLPVFQDGYSLIEIKRIGICGTDLHAFKGTQPFFEYPRIFGHELSATFDEGDTPGFVRGKRSHLFLISTVVNVLPAETVSLIVAYK